MGSNKRYGSDITEEVINELLLRPCPISLSSDEIGADSLSTPNTQTPVPVTAWVRFPETAIRVKGHAIGWTDRAVHVEFTLRDGRSLRSWVWRGAVTKRPGGQR